MVTSFAWPTYLEILTKYCFQFEQNIAINQDPAGLVITTLKLQRPTSQSYNQKTIKNSGIDVHVKY